MPGGLVNASMSAAINWALERANDDPFAAATQGPDSLAFEMPQIDTEEWTHLFAKRVTIDAPSMPVTMDLVGSGVWNKLIDTAGDTLSPTAARILCIVIVIDGDPDVPVAIDGAGSITGVGTLIKHAVIDAPGFVAAARNPDSEGVLINGTEGALSFETADEGEVTVTVVAIGKVS